MGRFKDAPFRQLATGRRRLHPAFGDALRRMRQRKQRRVSGHRLRAASARGPGPTARARVCEDRRTEQRVLDAMGHAEAQRASVILLHRRHPPSQQAKLVAIRVGQHVPAFVAFLADVGPAGARREQPV
jgi:hypothetical protein